MPLLSDFEAHRLRLLAATADCPIYLGRWIRALLADRAERISLAQQVSRQIDSARRIAQDDFDLVRLLTAAKKTADAPWAQQQPCRKCGAPAISVGTNGARNALIVKHPDGHRCLID